VSAAVVSLFNATARYVRKINRSRKFNRLRASKRLRRQMVEFWIPGLDALFSYMGKHDGWTKLQRHVQLHIAAEQFSKTMSDADRKFLLDLLSGFDYFNDRKVAAKARAIVQATSIPTFEEAAKFALGQLGIISPDFELRNDAVKQWLLTRSEAAIFSTRSYMAQAFQTITEQFYELGRHPYSREMIDELRDLLGYQADWQAQRFALTETGIAAELAQVETYRRNGIQAKQWNILNVNTRPDHLDIAGAIVGIDQKFALDPDGANGGPFAADHPLDPSLPPHELVNCHCWVSPVVDDDFEIDPRHAWEGQ
jgi:hypothetical protein